MRVKLNFIGDDRLRSGYSENIIKELTKLKLELEFRFSVRINNGRDRELLIKELGADYTNRLWRIL